MSQKIVVSKPSFNALTETDPRNLIFSSDYGTLKNFAKINQIVSFDANNDITGRGTYTHNLGYYPYVEIFTRIYIGSPSGNYEYCPFFGSGATVEYNANYSITTTQIVLFGEINGVSSSVWNFDFLIFLFKNNLNL